MVVYEQIRGVKEQLLLLWANDRGPKSSKQQLQSSPI